MEKMCIEEENHFLSIPIAEFTVGHAQAIEWYPIRLRGLINWAPPAHIPADVHERLGRLEEFINAVRDEMAARDFEQPFIEEESILLEIRPLAATEEQFARMLFLSRRLEYLPGFLRPDNYDQRYQGLITALEAQDGPDRFWGWGEEGREEPEDDDSEDLGAPVGESRSDAIAVVGKGGWSGDIAEAP